MADDNPPPKTARHPRQGAKGIRQAGEAVDLSCGVSAIFAHWVQCEAGIWSKRTGRHVETGEVLRHLLDRALRRYARPRWVEFGLLTGDPPYARRPAVPLRRRPAFGNSLVEPGMTLAVRRWAPAPTSSYLRRRRKATVERLDLREQIARIDRAQAEATKLRKEIQKIIPAPPPSPAEWPSLPWGVWGSHP